MSPRKCMFSSHNLPSSCTVLTLSYQQNISDAITSCMIAMEAKITKKEIVQAKEEMVELLASGSAKIKTETFRLITILVNYTDFKKVGAYSDFVSDLLRKTRIDKTIVLDKVREVGGMRWAPFLFLSHTSPSQTQFSWALSGRRGAHTCCGFQPWLSRRTRMARRARGRISTIGRRESV